VCYNGSGLDGLGGFSFIDGKYARRNKLLQLKCVCKVTWRLMIRVMPREVARFIQSRFGELKISEARYEDLLSEADQYYSSYLNSLSTIFKHT
jgi:intergrase/recombinase